MNSGALPRSINAQGFPQRRQGRFVWLGLNGPSERGSQAEGPPETGGRQVEEETGDEETSKHTGSQTSRYQAAPRGVTRWEELCEVLLPSPMTHVAHES